MTAASTLVLAIALVISTSTTVVDAFALRPTPVGVNTFARSDYRHPSKLIAAQDYNGGNEVRAFQTSRLFAASVDRKPQKKRGRFSSLFKRMYPLLGCSNRFLRRFRSVVASVIFFLLIANPAWAGNGRMGGSFGRSNRFQSPSRMRSVRPSGVNVSDKIRSNQRHRPAPIRVTYNPRHSARNRYRVYHNFHEENGEQVAGDGVAIVANTDGTTTYVRKVNTHPFADSRFSASDVVLGLGVAGVVTNGVVKRRSDREKYGDDGNLSCHPLGPGVSVWSMTACLDVPDLNDPTSIVHRMERLAETTSTVTRKGLQNVLGETSLELLRQLEKGTVTSVLSRYDHYRPSDQAVVRAERQYNRISTKERSKFDRESFSNYNGKIVRDVTEESEQMSPLVDSDSIASVALVQIHLVLEGNTMEPFGTRQIETRESFREALVQLSGDVSAVEDCVVAGEVLWAPQQDEKQEVMTVENVYAMYPTLW
eukprot:CAMPEP_0201119656 /NCGR_PEP_ID=MMETSP0850-20130426/3770_1 /ASSEMBLY_ACC=CAM_ASM_000622 /TAXON_ID=183588 /ORGANISM="Pseudo-nitzschia fraudulenta, Strain WWA7" /LENGTH=479 /DNA_ID=CAMNT_0047385453 /DNA_START=76 /DNA_END=1512 /DNA_ORIENTATION=+